MPKAKDISGSRYGKLVATKPSNKRRSSYVVWECQCDCGRVAEVALNHLVNGNTKSCGCLTYVDLTGQRFGRLVAQNRVQHGLDMKWRCLCDCGNEASVRSSALTKGDTKSCGCLWKETRGNTNLRHGHGRNRNRSRVYSVWDAMLSRCNNNKNSYYHNYGGRGINVCERWRRFEYFLEDMGEPLPNTTLDRVDNDGNYEPGNCRWATRKEQQRNRRVNNIIYWKGVALCATEWAERLGVTYDAIRHRHKRRSETWQETISHYAKKSGINETVISASKN